MTERQAPKCWVNNNGIRMRVIMQRVGWHEVRRPKGVRELGVSINRYCHSSPGFYVCNAWDNEQFCQGGKEVKLKGRLGLDRFPAI